MEQQVTTVPAGHRRNALGHLIPEGLIKPIDLLRDEVVLKQVAKAKDLQLQMQATKVQMQQEIADYLDLSASEYGVSYGGAKGNVSLVSFDGRYKLQIAVQDSISFDERLQAARVLIDECLADWTEGASPELQAIVNQAFDTDKEGQINTGRVLTLRRLDIQDERWQRAMLAIGEAIQVVGSRSYIRVYERIGESEQYRPIPLDIAGV